MARDFRDEYDSYHAKPEQKKRRAARNAARRKAIASGAVKKGDTKLVDYIGAPRLGSLEQVPTSVVSRKYNPSKQPKRS